MPLTPTQQTALDAFIATLGLAATPPVATATRWYVPTDAQATAFAARIGWTIHDLYGNRQGTVLASDGSDAEATLYASFGFRPAGDRYLWSSDNREAAQALCDKIAAAPTPQAANEIIKGAGDPGVTTDGACYLVMTGCVTGGGLMGTPRLGLAGATTIAEAVAVFFKMTTRKPGDPGPGIAG